MPKLRLKLMTSRLSHEKGTIKKAYDLEATDTSFVANLPSPPPILKKRRRTGELRTKDKVHVTKAVEDAHKLFDAIPHVFELHNTKRFDPPDGDLPKILAWMRRLEPGPLPDNLWKALADRVCEPNAARASCCDAASPGVASSWRPH